MTKVRDSAIVGGGGLVLTTKRPRNGCPNSIWIRILLIVNALGRCKAGGVTSSWWCTAIFDETKSNTSFEVRHDNRLVVKHQNYSDETSQTATISID